MCVGSALKQIQSRLKKDFWIFFFQNRLLPYTFLFLFFRFFYVKSNDSLLVWVRHCLLSRQLQPTNRCADPTPNSTQTLFTSFSVTYVMPLSGVLDSWGQLPPCLLKYKIKEIRFIWKYKGAAATKNDCASTAERTAERLTFPNTRWWQRTNQWNQRNQWNQQQQKQQ